jgi:hypothetical protein
MRADNLALLFTSRLTAAGIEHMVTGSVACIAWGEPRVTHDVDIVVELATLAQAESIERHFPFVDFYAPPIESIRLEMTRGLRGHFNIIHHDSGYRADIYLMGRDALHAWAFPRRQRIRVGEGELVLAPPEYVIVRKLEFFREGGSEKHLRDIASILRVSAPDVHLDEIVMLVERRGLQAPWEKARALARAEGSE